MDRFERNLINRYLSLRSATITALTPVNRVEALIQTLWPIKTEHDLIRLGPSLDGGYLVPDDLTGITACFSPGVGEECRFELDCVKRGMRVYMADASVDEPEGFPDQCKFRKQFIGAYSREEYISMDQWISDDLGDQQEDLLLQMDIEGAEYEVLLALARSSLKRFRIMVIEFHRLERLWNEPYFQLISNVFGKLLETHACVHSHPNVCSGIIDHEGVSMPRNIELTFLRRDRFQSEEFVKVLPHALDSVDYRGKRVVMPGNWFQSS
jgi:hypothetical protein